MRDLKGNVLDRTELPAQYPVKEPTEEIPPVSPTSVVVTPQPVQAPVNSLVVAPKANLSRIQPKRSKLGWPEPWFGVLIVVELLVIMVGFYLWLNNSPSNKAPTQAIPLNSNSVVALTVPGNGAVQAKTELKLSFGVAGTISEVLVKAGDRVTQGQELAKINDQQFQSNLNTAQANLNAAQLALASLKAGASETEIRIAQEQLNQAQLNLETVRNGTALPDEIQSARTRLVAAKASLEQINQGGSPAEKAKAQAALSTAQADLKAAQNKLDKSKAGPSDADIKAAQLKVNQAQAALEQTRVNFFKQVGDAQIARDPGLIALYNSEEKYKATYAQNRNTDGSLKSGLKETDLQKESEAYQQYQEALSAFNKLDTKLSDIRTAQYNALRNGETTLSQAQQQLEKVKAGPNSDEVATNEVQLAEAKAALDRASANLLKLTAPSAADVAKAQAEVDAAQANLTRLTTGGTATQIAAEEANVRSKELILQEVLKGPQPTDLALKQAQLEVRQAEYEQAAALLPYTTLKAPFSGTLGNFYLSPGQAIAADSEVGQLLDTSELQIQVRLSEAEISRVKVGQATVLNFEAIPEQSFTGKVTFFAPQAQPAYGKLAYLVTITLDKPGQNSLQAAFPEQYASYQQKLPTQTQALPNSKANWASSSGFSGYKLPTTGPAGLEVQPKLGMNASVLICLDIKAGVSSVPNELIQTKLENGQPVKFVKVFTSDTQTATDRIITTGLQGDALTEVTGGELKNTDSLILGS